MPDFNALRTQIRRIRHATFGVCAVYDDAQSGVYAEDIRVEHNVKENILGDIVRDGYTESVEYIHTIKFSTDELSQKSFMLRRGARVTMPSGEVLILSTKLPQIGPINVFWRAVEE